MDRERTAFEPLAGNLHWPSIRFMVRREGNSPIPKFDAYARARMNAPMDFRLPEPAIGPAQPPRQHRLAPWIFGARYAMQSLRARRSIGAGRVARPRTLILAHVERLTWDERRRATTLWDRLQSSGDARPVNHPTRILCRYELKRALSPGDRMALARTVRATGDCPDDAPRA